MSLRTSSTSASRAAVATLAEAVCQAVAVRHATAAVSPASKTRRFRKVLTRIQLLPRIQDQTCTENITKTRTAAWLQRGLDPFKIPLEAPLFLSPRHIIFLWRHGAKNNSQVARRGPLGTLRPTGLITRRGGGLGRRRRADVPPSGAGPEHCDEHACTPASSSVDNGGALMLPTEQQSVIPGRSGRERRGTRRCADPPGGRSAAAGLGEHRLARRRHGRQQ